MTDSYFQHSAFYSTEATLQAILAQLQSTPPSGNLQSIGLVANGLVGTLPANSMLLWALFHNTGSVSVNIEIGTSSADNSILHSTAVASDTTVAIPVNLFLVNGFSTATAIWVSSASWTSGAVINATLGYQVSP